MPPCCYMNFRSDTINHMDGSNEASANVISIFPSRPTRHTYVYRVHAVRYMLWRCVDVCEEASSSMVALRLRHFSKILFPVPLCNLQPLALVSARDAPDLTDITQAHTTTTTTTTRLGDTSCTRMLTYPDVCSRESWTASPRSGSLNEIIVWQIRDAMANVTLC